MRDSLGRDSSTDPPGQRPGEASPLAVATLERRKRRDAAIALPLAAAVLFASPLLDLAASAGSLFGIPVGVLYVFGVWFALIALTARLARRLIRDGEA